MKSGLDTFLLPQQALFSQAVAGRSGYIASALQRKVTFPTETSYRAGDQGGSADLIDLAGDALRPLGNALEGIVGKERRAFLEPDNFALAAARQAGTLDDARYTQLSGDYGIECLE